MVELAPGEWTTYGAQSLSDHRNQPLDFDTHPGKIGEDSLRFFDGAHEIIAARDAAARHFRRKIARGRCARFTNGKRLRVREKNLLELLSLGMSHS